MSQGFAATADLWKPPELVATLPTSPIDGQECYYLADATNGIIWHLRYRAASASAYKWEYVGGSPLFAEIATSEATASATYVGLTTPGPQITPPLVGDYMVAIGAAMNNSTAGAVSAMSYAIGATVASDVDHARLVSGNGNNEAAVFFERRKNGLTVVALTASYKQIAGGTATFTRRWMRVQPVRVG